MSDPVLLITGASSGIGAATARQAAKAGYRLALAARSADKLQRLVDEIGPQRAIAIRCDVTDYAEQQAMVQQVLERFGQLDAVYANAGIPGSEGGFSAADPAVWNEMLLTNVAQGQPRPSAAHRLGGRALRHSRFDV
jgi:NADP-dependent 3-hydroxy acid dehydrogenase YdfG